MSRFKKQIAALLATASLGTGGVMYGDAQINAYTDKGDKLEIVEQSTLTDAGNNKITAHKDRAAVTLGKWNDEATFTVAYDKVKASGGRALLTNRVEWKDAKEELHSYPLPAGEGMEDGGYEIEVYLKEKPDTNVFNFTIEGAEELDFFYQPELTPEEIAQGAFRPDNVIGSYAVYHKDKADHLVGGQNYATGKAFHIYRPKAIDANDNEVWGDLSYSNGTLTVTVPQGFLDTATYPVRVDPTFGYTSVGASASTNRSANRAEVGKKTLTESGSVTKISIAENISSGSPQTKAVIYDDDGVGAIPSTLIAVSSAASVVDDTFVDYTVSVSLAAGDWWLGGIVDSLGVQLRYDSNAGDSGSNDSSDTNSFASPTAWTQSFTNNNRRQSVYATYTASSPATPTTTPYININNATININNINNGSVRIQ